MKAEFIGYDPGFHNDHLESEIARLKQSGHYKDQSIVVVIPTLNTVASKAASSWWNLMFPPNQRVVKIFANNLEVGEAYSQTIDGLLAHPELSTYRFMVTLEADNVVPPDAILKLLAKMEAHPEFAAISGLYWTKGEGGVPQIWGDASDPVQNFRPQDPVPGEMVECCGIGMGCAIWRMSMFTDPRLRKPWFKTIAGPEGVGTQDLSFWSDARKYGYRCAVDCSVLVGHVDTTGFVW